MQKITTLSSSLALLLSVVSAQSGYDTTICDNERYGDFSDPIMYYPNAWNPNSPDDGFICMKVDNSTPAYDATWNWGTDIQDVHSFPYVRLSHPDLPIRLSDLTSIRLATQWIYTPGSPDEPPRDFSQETWQKNKAELESGRIQTNAAWDFFLDDDRNRTLYAQDAAIEFMVWLGSVGDPWWLGRLEETILSKVTLGETEFTLYYGRNSGGTHVFTAVPPEGEDVLSLDEDFYPLFEYILEQARSHPDVSEDLPQDPYLGVVEFGTETWFSSGNVTFTAANFGMTLNEPLDDDNDNGNGTDDGSTDEDEDNAASSVGMSVLSAVVPASLALLALIA